MEWIEASVSTTTEGAELVFGALLACGVNGAQIIDDTDMQHFLTTHPYAWDYVDEGLSSAKDTGVRVVFYVTPDAAGRETLTQVQTRLSILAEEDFGFPLGDLVLSHAAVDDNTWLHEWKKYYKPFRIGRAVVVRPLWEAYTSVPGDVVCTLNPGSVFGTGLHQTTRLCAATLEDLIKPGDSVLDIGCGSGILSLIALLLGADSVVACDLDPAAVTSAKENAALNPVEISQFTVRAGDVLSDSDLRTEVSQKSYDIIVANIVADVVIALIPSVKGWLARGGRFIASGVIAERVGDVRAAIKDGGFALDALTEQDGWYCLVCSHA